MITKERVTENPVQEDDFPSLWETSVKRMKCRILTVLIILISSPAVAQDYSDDVNWLIDVLELREGSVVADIGAGDGEQTLEMARYVGASGRVYSSELGEESLHELREAVESASVENVTIVEGHPTRTNLPDACCDAIFLRRVYHHFGDPALMNASLFRSLKPGGRLAVIDFEPRGSESEEPDGRGSGSQHGVTAETIVEELRQAGFVLVSSEQRSGRDVYVVVVKPEDG